MAVLILMPNNIMAFGLMPYVLEFVIYLLVTAVVNFRVLFTCYFKIHLG